MASVAAVVTALTGLLVFLGWALDVPSLRHLPPDPIVMLPNAAVAFMLAGTSLWFRLRDPASSRVRYAGSILAAVVLACGTFWLAERISGYSSPLDRLLFLDALRQYPYRPLGLIATNSALSVAIAGAGLLLLNFETAEGTRPSQLLASIGLAIALLAIVGHLYGAESLYAIDQAAGMALATALAFLVLHLGILFARPRSGAIALITGDDMGGMLARRLLPGTFAVPLVLGWLWLRGREWRYFSGEGGLALMTLTTMGILVSLVLRNAHALRRADHARALVLDREAAARAEAEHLATALLAQTATLAELASEARRAADTAELARAAAEQANRAKMEFLTTMSHELRTPLNAIDGYAELMEMGLRGPVTPQQLEDLARIRRSERYLLSLVNDVLNFARLDAGRVHWHIEKVRVADVLADTEPMILPLMRAKRMDYVITECRAVVLADREKLRQLLVNVIGNACKFTPEGGFVRVDCEDGVSQVRIAVRDSGRGIPADQIRNIFEPFVQVDRHLVNESQQGVGLGLAISRDLARGMGGDLVAESIVGTGSVFYLTLPSVPPVLAETADASGTPAQERLHSA